MAAIQRTRLRTYISETYWCDPARKYEFARARLQLPGSALGEQQTTTWLDELLDGGIVMPASNEEAKTESRANALTLLITGTAGTGKSTLATELCYRWCTTNAWETVLPKEKRPRVLYITNESKASWMIENAASMHWPNVGEVFEQTDDNRKPIQRGKVRILGARTTSELKDISVKLAQEDFLDSIMGMVGKADRLDADVVVVDSLNTVLGRTVQTDLFASFYRWASSGPRILITILDSPGNDGPAEVWEYASDLVVRLDRKYDVLGYSGYMIRSLEIVKARYQKHIWGRHQLKIHEGSASEAQTASTDPQTASDRMRAHPYRLQGGVFVFPSIHYILSLYKRKAPTVKKDDIASRVLNLNRLLGKGYPNGRCTAMIGLRGGHKSHLGYEEILDRLCSPEGAAERALVVSLRDDEGLTKETMRKILERRRGLKTEQAENVLSELQATGRLEITYYPPGYITPEEFFHRLLLSIKRLKASAAEGKNGAGAGQSGPHVSLLFNSLEQLSSRFPLCAKEPIFIPGIIQMLTAEEVSSFFVTAAVDESAETYGLETMAELILEFGRRTCTAKEYCAKAKAVFPGGDWRAIRRRVRGKRQVVTLRVGRYAGGQAAGAEGILELIDSNHPLHDLAKNSGLVFLPG